MQENSTVSPCPTIGIDLGDKRHQLCALAPDGAIAMEGRIDNTPAGAGGGARGAARGPGRLKGAPTIWRA